MGTYNRYKRNGEPGTFWEFRAYLGVDIATGKDIKVSRRLGGDRRPFKTKREAVNEVRRLRVEFDERSKEAYKAKGFEAVYNEWLNDWYMSSVRPSTLAKTKGFFERHILPVLGDKEVSKITIEECDDFVRGMHSTGLSIYKEVIQYAIRVMDYAVYKEYAKNNLLKVCYIPEVKGSKKASNEVESFTKEELKEFLEESKRYGRGNMWYVFFRLLAYSGCRKGEVLALTWDDINFEEKTITLNKTLAKVSGKQVMVSESTKNGKGRTIPIDDKTLNLLKDETKKECNIVFPAQTNKNNYIHPDLPNTVMKRILKRTSITKNITPHGLRHTHASILFESGSTIKDVQNRLGHSSSVITMDIYTHITESRERNTINSFSDALKT